MKYFTGLDVSLEETAICIVDEDGIDRNRPIFINRKERITKATEEADTARRFPEALRSYAWTSKS